MFSGKHGEKHHKSSRRDHEEKTKDKSSHKRKHKDRKEDKEERSEKKLKLDIPAAPKEVCECIYYNLFLIQREAVPESPFLFILLTFKIKHDFNRLDGRT